MMKTGCSKHGVTHGDSFSFPRIFNQSRQNRANKRWGVCFGGQGSSLAPVLLQFCVRWDEPTAPLHFRLYFWAEMPLLPFHELRGFGKSSQLPFSTSDSTGNFPPSLTSAFHSPGPGGTRCYWVVTEEAQWCKPDHPVASFDTPTASQPTKSEVISTASLLLLISQWMHIVQKPSKCKMLLAHVAGPHKALAPTDPSECSAEGRYRMCSLAPWSDISHTNVPV